MALLAKGGRVLVIFIPDGVDQEQVKTMARVLSMRLDRMAERAEARCLRCGESYVEGLPHDCRGEMRH